MAAEAPLAYAAAIAEARALAYRSREASSLALQLGAVVAQLDALAAIPSLPDDFPLPGDELLDVLGLEAGTLQARRDQLSQAAAELTALADAHPEHQAALDGLLAQQQQAMFDPASQPTIAVLKQLGARQTEAGQRAGAIRQLLAQLRPLAASLRSPVEAVRAGARARIAAVLDEDPAPDIESLNARIAVLDDERTELETTHDALEAQIRALTG